jgi:hypothetical protein
MRSQILLFLILAIGLVCANEIRLDLSPRELIDEDDNDMELFEQYPEEEDWDTDSFRQLDD